MKKPIVLLWVVLILPIASLFAQTEEDKKEVYDQLKEWAVVKLTIAYMEDLYSFTPNNKGKRGTTREFETYLRLNKIYSLNNDSIDLVEVSNLLVNGDWKNTKRNTFDKYKIEIIDNEKRSDFNNIKPYGYVNKINKSSFESFLEEIKNEYKNRLDNKFETNKKEDKVQTKEKKNEKKVVVEGNKQEKLLSNRQNSTKNKSNDNFSYYNFLGILSVLVIVIIILFSKNKKLKDNLDSFKKNVHSNRKQPENDMFNPTVQNLRKENNKLKEENNKLKEENQESNNKLDNVLLTYNDNSQTEDLSSQEIELEVPIQQTESNIIYLSSPFQELTFANEDASKQKNSNSLYLVDFNLQTQSGKLSINEDADFTRALNSPDTFLKTVCIYENEYKNNARTVVTIEKGEIKTEGEDWVVTKKVRIKFI